MVTSLHKVTDVIEEFTRPLKDLLELPVPLKMNSNIVTVQRPVQGRRVAILATTNSAP